MLMVPTVTLVLLTPGIMVLIVSTSKILARLTMVLTVQSVKLDTLQKLPLSGGVMAKTELIVLEIMLSLQ